MHPNKRWTNPWCWHCLFQGGFFPSPTNLLVRRMYQRGWSTNSSYIGRTIWTSFHLGLCRNWDSTDDIVTKHDSFLVVFDVFLVKMPQSFCALPATVFRGVSCGNKFNIRSAEFSHIFSETFKMMKKKHLFFLSFSTLHIVFTPFFWVENFCGKFEASYMLVTMGIFNVILAVPWITCSRRWWPEGGLKVAPKLVTTGGTLRIPRGDWGTLGKIRGITTPP